MASVKAALSWTLVLSCIVFALLLRLLCELLCWKGERDQAYGLDTVTTMTRLVAGLLCAASTKPRRRQGVAGSADEQRSSAAGRRQPPLWLRIACYVEVALYAISYLPHMLMTFVLNDVPTLTALLTACVDVQTTRGAALVQAAFVLDYAGTVASSGLLCWTALRRPRSGPLLLLWAVYCGVGITVALRQGVMAASVRGFLWGLVLSSLAQLAHYFWNLLLLLMLVEGGSRRRRRPRSDWGGRPASGCAARVQALRIRALALVDPRPDAMGFFRVDGRWLVDLLAIACNFGIVLYQVRRTVMRGQPGTKVVIAPLQLPKFSSLRGL
ncbi:uncharacterized protein LOC144142942 [Haemaphysalis longicornis]